MSSMSESEQFNLELAAAPGLDDSTVVLLEGQDSPSRSLDGGADEEAYSSSAVDDVSSPAPGMQEKGYEENENEGEEHVESTESLIGVIPGAENVGASLLINCEANGQASQHGSQPFTPLSSSEQVDLSEMMPAIQVLKPEGLKLPIDENRCLNDIRGVIVQEGNGHASAEEDVELIDKVYDPTTLGLESTCDVSGTGSTDAAVDSGTDFLDDALLLEASNPVQPSSPVNDRIRTAAKKPMNRKRSHGEIEKADKDLISVITEDLEAEEETDEDAGVSGGQPVKDQLLELSATNVSEDIFVYSENNTLLDQSINASDVSSVDKEDCLDVELDEITAESCPSTVLVEIPPEDEESMEIVNCAANEFVATSGELSESKPILSYQKVSLGRITAEGISEQAYHSPTIEGSDGFQSAASPADTQSPTICSFNSELDKPTSLGLSLQNLSESQPKDIMEILHEATSCAATGLIFVQKDGEEKHKTTSAENGMELGRCDLADEITVKLLDNDVDRHDAHEVEALEGVPAQDADESGEELEENSVDKLEPQDAQKPKSELISSEELVSHVHDAHEVEALEGVSAQDADESGEEFEENSADKFEPHNAQKPKSELISSEELVSHVHDAQEVEALEGVSAQDADESSEELEENSVDKFEPQDAQKPKSELISSEELVSHVQTAAEADELHNQAKVKLITALGGKRAYDTKVKISGKGVANIGKYQFTTSLLAKLGYFKPTEKWSPKNSWQGAWLGKNGVKSMKDFLASGDVQDLAITEALNQCVENQPCEEENLVKDFYVSIQ